tara:strand:+ start:717 stop:2516 length:1800 start_codon:yes stop_codon:yes gene_type:complete
MENKILHGDSLDLLKDLDDNSVDNIVTDPPYGYSFMGKDWDKALPSIDIWKECVRVLKPGAFAFIMSAPRSDVHSRMCLMLEEAGFRIDFTPIAWTYATGFPKAMNIGKAVDKRRKGERDGKSKEFSEYIKSQREKLGLTKGYLDKEVCGGSSMYSFYEGRNNENGDWAVYLPTETRYKKLKNLLKMDNRFDDYIENTLKVVDVKEGNFGYQKDGERWSGKQNITKTNSDEAKQLDGSYAGYQPKPAWENVIVCMKPLDQKGYLDQALNNGKGVTWLDDCRVPFADPNIEDKRLIEGGSWDTSKAGENIYSGGWVGKRISAPMKKKKMTDKKKSDYDKYVEGIKRFPNPGFGGSENVYGDNTTEHSKKKKSDYEKYVEKQKSFKGAKTIGKTNEGGNTFLGGDIKQTDPSEIYQKEPMGRFPANLLVQDDVLNDGILRRDFPKGGPTNSSYIFSPGEYGKKNKQQAVVQGKTYYSDNFSRYYDLDAWWEKRIKELPLNVQTTYPFMIVPKASKSEKNKGLDKNNHPTVKPISLMSYLVTLGSREDELVLDPFVGSGTTCIAAKLLNRKYIGMEMDSDYVVIAQTRIEAHEPETKQHDFF